MRFWQTEGDSPARDRRLGTGYWHGCCSRDAARAPLGDSGTHGIVVAARAGFEKRTAVPVPGGGSDRLRPPPFLPGTTRGCVRDPSFIYRFLSEECLSSAVSLASCFNDRSGAEASATAGAGLSGFTLGGGSVPSLHPPAAPGTSAPHGWPVPGRAPGRVLLERDQANCVPGQCR